jgi:hypothetical protein
MQGSKWNKTTNPYPDLAAPPGVVFHVHGISKIYHMGDIEVSALLSSAMSIDNHSQLPQHNTGG